MRKFGAVVFLIFFSLSIAIMGVFYYFFLQGEQIDPQYATKNFECEIETRIFEFEAFNRLYFLNDHDPFLDYTKRTEFLKAVPTVKIVNSEDHRLEISTNADAFEKLKMDLKVDPENSDIVTLVFAIADDCYVRVHEDDPSYDYDTGLYVGFDKLEVTVYAPLSGFYTDSAIILDYEAPECERMSVNLSFDKTKADIHGICTDTFSMTCGGTSDVKLSGEVRENARIRIWHNTKVDASELMSENKDFEISSAILGLSYIKHDNKIYLERFDDMFVSKIIIMMMVHIPPVIWLCCVVACVRRREDD